MPADRERLSERTLWELRELVARGEARPSEIAEDLLATVEEKEPLVKAYLEVYGEELLERARELDGRKPEGPLFGLPVAVKDNICVAGKRTTCASKILEPYRSPYDATAVRKLKEAGALVSGKTNLDEFAMGSSTENSAFGPTHNPWDLGRAPGGSSGGSAAAVAAGTAIAALGSDTGGSIRQPASFCGVVGCKPTYGRVSRYGLVAFASSLDQIGPITRDVRDCALLLSVISGEDPLDATSVDAPVPDLVSSLDRGLEGLVVGVPWDFLEGEMDEDGKDNFSSLVNQLEGSGVEVRPVELPHARYAVACYYVIANAEASSNLARYDGVKYGYRAPQYRDLYSLYTRTRGEGFGEEVKRRILLGTYVLSAGYYDAYYLQAQKVRSLVIRDFEEAFTKCHLIMIPTSPTPAFKLGEKLEDPLLMYLSDIFTIPANLAGLPAVAVPTGLSRDRLPLGVQLMAPPLEEATVLRGAFGIERLVGFGEKPPLGGGSGEG